MGLAHPRLNPVMIFHRAGIADAGTVFFYYIWEKIRMTAIPRKSHADKDGPCRKSDSHGGERGNAQAREGEKWSKHWHWRNEMAMAMAEALDMERFGVRALYLIGSTKTGEAGPCSDIDLLAHCTDEPVRHQALQSFYEGWGLCLALVNRERTGYRIKGSLVDLHIVTDADIEKRDSFAAMIGSVHNSARLLRKSANDE